MVDWRNGHLRIVVLDIKMLARRCGTMLRSSLGVVGVRSVLDILGLRSSMPGRDVAS
jgi:hypothetical protein